MRYRRLSAATSPDSADGGQPGGDSIFGGSQNDFLRDTSSTVAQAIKTRLSLFKGDFFLDSEAGIDWRSRVLGTNTSGLYDITIRERILGTQGVLSILEYHSQRNGETRTLSVQCLVETLYGHTRLNAVVPTVFVYPPGSGPAANYLLGQDGDTLDGVGLDPLIAG